MNRVIFAFAGKKAELKAQLAAAVAQEQGKSNVIYLRHCELCGRLARGEICRRCEPMFRRWVKKTAAELAANTISIDPTIA